MNKCIPSSVKPFWFYSTLHKKNHPPIQVRNIYIQYIVIYYWTLKSDLLWSGVSLCLAVKNKTKRTVKFKLQEQEINTISNLSAIRKTIILYDRILRPYTVIWFSWSGTLSWENSTFSPVLCLNLQYLCSHMHNLLSPRVLLLLIIKCVYLPITLKHHWVSLLLQPSFPTKIKY